MTVRIGARGSPLSLAQTGQLRDALAAANPGRASRGESNIGIRRTPSNTQERNIPALRVAPQAWRRRISSGCARYASHFPKARHDHGASPTPIRRHAHTPPTVPVTTEK